MVSQIYPSELQLDEANTSDTEAAFLDLHLSISSDTVSTKIYDKLSFWKLSISHFRWWCSSLYILWSLYLSTHSIARASNHVADFNTRNKLFTQKLLNNAIGITNFTKSFLNFIDNTLIWYQNSKLDLNVSCAKDCCLLLSLYLCFISFLYLDLYVLGDDALIR